MPIWACFLLGCGLLLLFGGCKARPGVRLAAPDRDEAQALMVSVERLNTQARYAEAVPKARELVAIVEKSKGADHPGTASALNILGGLLVSTADYVSAVPILERAVRILESSGQDDSPMLAASLGLLAKTRLALGHLPEAEQSAAHAYSLRAKTAGPDTLVASTALHTLAVIHTEMGRFDVAETEFLEVVAIRAAKENVHSLIIALNGLTSLYCATGRFAEAEPLARDALQFGLEMLGPNHPHVGETFMILGRIHAATGRGLQGLDYMWRAHLADLSSIDSLGGVTSERQQAAFVAGQAERLHELLSVSVALGEASPEAARVGMDAILQRKGIVLETQKAFVHACAKGDDALLRIADELVEVRARITPFALAGLDEDAVWASSANLRELEARKEALERRLAEQSDTYRRLRAQARASAESVAAVLPKGSALVELAGVVDPESGGRRYLAFVLKQGEPDGVQVADLGSAAAIDSAIVRARAALMAGAPYNNTADPMLQALHETVLAPLLPALKGVGSVFVSPDGGLNLLPLEILMDGTRRYVVEKYQVTYLNSGRDLIGEPESEQRSAPPLLMGAPLFALDEDESAPKAENTAVFNFSPLPGTRREVLAIGEVLSSFKPQVALGRKATEERLFSVRSPRYLHLATHGFFLSRSEVRRMKGARGLQVCSLVTEATPLSRAGIVLAGANAPMGPHWGEGVVTAEKILGMDLRGTELVVLSACETAVGEVDEGEGVYGLQRAFAQAGAKGLIMSMWPVQDRETMELMADFYSRLTRGAQATGPALRQAMLAAMDRAEQRYGVRHPALWGAFIFKQCAPTQSR